VALTVHTTGTTGTRTSVAFSAHELDMLSGLAALGYVLGNDLSAEDVVQVSGDPRGIGAYVLSAAIARIGAVALAGGAFDARTTVLQADASCIGQLLEAAARNGSRPSRSLLRRVFTGGETVTQGLRRRLSKHFGDVRVVETYGMTETFGAGGLLCTHGHLHFHPAHALVEVIDPRTGVTAQPGHTGNLVVTPLPPFRETTLLLRYDTEDVATQLPAPPTCELRGLPAVGPLLGTRQLAVEHDHGYTFPRDLLEALEALDEVPLPARCGMWPIGGGVGIEVLVRQDTPAIRAHIADALEARAVPLRALNLHTNRSALRHALPVRCDMRG
jgi:phenylacetate-coenzyme A ligase PaaK-like adenylate-forming protein